MSYLENWPLGSRAGIEIGKPESNLGVATLWTKRKNISEHLPSESYSIVGQLYEKFGISHLLRNLAANPHLRRLVVCGADLSGSGDALVRLWRDGVSDSHTILGVQKAPLQPEIPREAIDLIRANVELFDWRSVSHKELIPRLQQLAFLNETLDPWGEPQVFPDSEIILGQPLPSESGSHTVRGRTIAETWLKLLREVMEYGVDAPTNYQFHARDLSNLVAVVTDEDPHHPYIPDYFNFTSEEAASYISEFTSPDLPKDLFYTYGERFKRFGPLRIGAKDIYLDQEQVVLDKLRKDPNDRGALAILYSTIKDNQLDRASKVNINTSCIVSYQFSIKDNALELLTVFRSNDIFSAWPRNSFGLRSIQSRIAGELGVGLGPLVTVSTRAHIYSDKWLYARELVDEQLPKIKEGFSADPRGNIVITADHTEGRISFLQQDSATGQPLRPEIQVDGQRNRATFAATNELAKRGLISSVDHALDIGAETIKAEIAIKAGLEYRQDDPDFLKKVIALIEDGQKYRKRST